MKANPSWIVADQAPEIMKRHPGAIWVHRCLRCHAEEPALPGLIGDVVKQGEKFIKLHKLCVVE